MKGFAQELAKLVEDAENSKRAFDGLKVEEVGDNRNYTRVRIIKLKGTPFHNDFNEGRRVFKVTSPEFIGLADQPRSQRIAMYELDRNFNIIPDSGFSLSREEAEKSSEWRIPGEKPLKERLAETFGAFLPNRKAKK